MRRQRGFTLLELILSIVIIGVISVVVGRIIFQSFKTFTIAQNVSDIDWQGLLVMENFANDVHTIRSANDISTITSSNFSFVNTSGTTVTYQLSGSTLTRNSQTLATGVQSIGFAYYDKNYSVTATAANVRYITFTATFLQNNLSLPFITMAGTRGMS